MNIHEIAENVQERFSIGELQIDGTLFSITIDTIPVQIEEIDNSILLLTGLIGEPPTHNTEVFANLLLESNLALMYQRNYAIARHAETGSYVLLERFPIGTSDLDEFYEHLEKFADILENYHKILEEFRLTSHETAREHDMMTALRNGFIQV